MEAFDKVEKLRERANVSYEEAKAALEACEWDLLDAMVYLEKLGKAEGPAQSTYSTEYEKQQEYGSVQETIKEQKEVHERSIFDKLRSLIRKGIQKCRGTSLCINCSEKEVIKIPVWLFLLGLFINWKLVAIAIIISLFFGCRYSFVGKENLEGANKAMEKASEFADRIKEEYKKL